MKLIEYVETVEVPTYSTSKLRFYFEEQPTLRDKIVVNIYTYLAANVTKAPNSGKALVSNTVLDKSFLVLVSKNKEVINRIPVRQLTGYTYFTLPPVINRIIDFPKSYIEIGSAASISASETFLFTFYCAERCLKIVPAGSGLNIDIVEIKTTPATIQKFMLPDHENLRGKRIHSIESSQAFMTMTPSGASLVNDTVRKKSYLTIASKGNEIIKKMPLWDLNPANYNGYKFPFSVIPDLPKCYIECTDTTDLVADEVYLLYFLYWDKQIGRR